MAEKLYVEKSTKTRDSKGNVKWLGLKNHMEKLLKDEPDTLSPVFGGFQKFAERVELGRIEPGYIIYMTRSLEDTSAGQKIVSLDPTGLLTNIIKKSVNRKYWFAHAAIYVGKWEEIHYFVENGGPNTGKEFLKREHTKKFHSAIQLIDARQVISSNPFIAMSIPWGKHIETENGKKIKLWPNQVEFLQQSLAAVGFPFNYNLRTRSCETFTLLLLGIGEIDLGQVSPQLDIVSEDANWLTKRYITYPPTENDLKDFEEFQAEYKNWVSGRQHFIDANLFKVEKGIVVPNDI